MSGSAMDTSGGGGGNGGAQGGGGGGRGPGKPQCQICQRWHYGYCFLCPTCNQRHRRLRYGESCLNQVQQHQNTFLPNAQWAGSLQAPMMAQGLGAGFGQMFGGGFGQNPMFGFGQNLGMQPFVQPGSFASPTFVPVAVPVAASGGAGGKVHRGSRGGRGRGKGEQGGGRDKGEQSGEKGDKVTKPAPAVSRSKKARIRKKKQTENLRAELEALKKQPGTAEDKEMEDAAGEKPERDPKDRKDDDDSAGATGEAIPISPKGQ